MRLRFAPSPPVRRVFFLVPGTTDLYRCGGLAVALHSARLVGAFVPAELLTYRQREQDHLFLDDLVAEDLAPEAALFVISWGFEVPKLLRRLRGCSLAYHAHSSGYGFDLPPGVPVLAVSRNTLGYWGDRAPRNPLFLVPNALNPYWFEKGARSGTAAAFSIGKRPVDVLVQERKSSRYVLKQLVPALRQRGLKVEVQSGWIDDLVGLFNSAKVYLYDSAEYWRSHQVSEGFGLPPLEAMACGCVVFSSLNHALADHLEPGVFGHQIGCGSLDWDVQRICQAVANPSAWCPSPERLNDVLLQHTETSVIEHWQFALQAIESMPSDVMPLKMLPKWRLRISRLMSRAMKILRRLRVSG